MKECAAVLSKVYGVAMVDGTTEGGRLQETTLTAACEGAWMDDDMRDEIDEPLDEDLHGEPEDLPATERSVRSAPARRPGFLAGVLLGAAVGAALGMLFAPERGDRARQRLR